MPGVCSYFLLLVTSNLTPVVVALSFHLGPPNDYWYIHLSWFGQDLT